MDCLEPRLDFGGAFRQRSAQIIQVLVERPASPARHRARGVSRHDRGHPLTDISPNDRSLSGTGARQPRPAL